MTLLLYANNASTTLASNLSSSATTIALASGSGALFQSPGGGQGFYATLFDAATKLNIEIVLVTNVTGDTLTVVRSQQSTSARNYSVGDFIMQDVTAGDLRNFLQQGSVTSAPLLGLSSGALVDVTPDGYTTQISGGALQTVQAYGEAAYNALNSTSAITGSFVFPSGAKKAKIRGWGPGGRGGAGGGGFGSGGNGGGYFEGFFAISAGSTYNYSVAAMITSGADSQQNNTPTIFVFPGGGYWQATAGANGAAGTSGGGIGVNVGYAGTGSSTYGSLVYLLTGGGGSNGVQYSSAGNGQGGTCGSSPGFANPVPGGGGVYSGSTNGQFGAFPGVGGGGGVGGGTGGAGGGGLLIVEWWS